MFLLLKTPENMWANYQTLFPHATKMFINFVSATMFPTLVCGFLKDMHIYAQSHRKVPKPKKLAKYRDTVLQKFFIQ